jgi:hypothetical protein
MLESARRLRFLGEAESVDSSLSQLAVMGVGRHPQRATVSVYCQDRINYPLKVIH